MANSSTSGTQVEAEALRRQQPDVGRRAARSRCATPDDQQHGREVERVEEREAGARLDREA